MLICFIAISIPVSFVILAVVSVKKKDAEYDEQTIIMRYGSNALKDVKTFKSSLIKYMLHRNIFRYLILFFIIIANIKLFSFDDGLPYEIFADILVTYIILGMSYKNETVFIAPHEVYYKSSFYNDSSSSNDDRYGKTSTHYLSTARIKNISKIEENYNSIIVYGDTTIDETMKTESHGSYRDNVNYEDHEVTHKMKLKKDFIDNKGLLKALKQKMDENFASKEEVQPVEIGCTVELFDEKSNKELTIKIIDSNEMRLLSGNDGMLLSGPWGIGVRMKFSPEQINIIGKKIGESISWQEKDVECIYKIVSIYK